MFKNKIVLVTGGAGFIGSHIAEKALELDAEKVIVLDNLIFGSLSKIQNMRNNKRFEFVKGDVTDSNLFYFLHICYLPKQMHRNYCFGFFRYLFF